MDYRNLINQFRYHPYLSTVFVALIIGGQAWGIVGEVQTPDKEMDYWVVSIWAYSCDPFSLPDTIDHSDLTRNPIKWWLNCASYQWFGNIKVLPVIFNIGVMPLVYLVAISITKDKLIGVIALIAFLYNPLYSDWKYSGTYDQTWAFFLLLSVWLMFRTKLNGMSYLVSIAAKSVSILYLPAWLYTNYQTRKSKIELVIMLGIFIAGIALASQFVNIGGTSIGFHPERWEDAAYRNIGVLWQVIPFAVFIVLSRTFIPQTKAHGGRVCGVWMLCALLQNPIVYLFSMQDTYSYRYVPLAAFMSIFIGITLVNVGNWYQELQLRKITPKI